MSRLPNLGELYKVRRAVAVGAAALLGPPVAVIDVVAGFAVLLPLIALVLPLSFLASTLRDTRLEAWATDRMRVSSER